MANIEFVWWWMLYLIPLPFAIYKLLPSTQHRSPIYLPALPQAGSGNRPKQGLIKLLTALVWLFLLVAAARPVWFGDPITATPKHRDLMLVVDLSSSMSQEDMRQGDEYIDRLSAVKQVLSEFIKKRQGDRLGLVLFADHAYLQTPLTLDRHTISEQLQRTILRLIGNRTAIGEGIGLATKTFIDGDAPQRVMILLSDGSNTAGVLDPIQAAKIAKKYHATIYTIGVGAGEMTVRGLLMDRTINTAQDLDEDTLKQIANITGGKYFRARDSQDLANIYDTINQLEPVSVANQTWRPQTEWFGLPLALALILSVLLAVMRRNHV